MIDRQTQMTNKKTLTHIDLFAGPGGVSTGFRAAGITTIAAVEKVQSCVETFSRNHPTVHVIHKDIRHVERSDFQPNLTSVDIVTAGVPCETFSTAGSSSRSFYDHRQTLFNDAIRIASYFDATYLLIENVPAIETKRISKTSPIRVVDVLYKNLQEAGYHNIRTVILDAADFGVPQRRLRFFCLASKEDKDLLVPTTTKFQTSTVKDALAGLPPLEANRQTEENYLAEDNTYTELMKNQKFWKLPFKHGNKPSYHNAPNHRERTLKRFSLIEQGEGLKDLFLKLGEAKVKEMQEKGILPNKWFIQRNRRLVPLSSSPTVTSHCLDELLHPFQNRALSVREAARLQSFPDGYDFVGGPYLCPHIYETQDKYEQIGDAVPPLMAYHWGLALLESETSNGQSKPSVARRGQLQLQI
jgi:DNA (cytosine-5)-methyltransferase 1